MSSDEEIPIPRRTEEYEASIFDREFTEEDVLPFLLQAQDIISKLESRVVELEKDLSTIHCKYEHDKNEWLIGLSQKDQYINHLSKLDINNEEQVKSVTNLCLQYLRQAQNTKEDDLEEGELERRQAAVAEWSQQHIPEHSSLQAEEPLNLMDGLSSTSSGSSSHIPYPKPSLYIQLDEQQENNQCCMNCKQLLAQLDEQIEQKAYLKRDLGSLAAALSEQEEIRSTIEQDKEALEEDVADITSTLFSSLNQILMDDVTERDGVVQLNREMNGQLASLLDSWDIRELRLKEMKEALVQLDSAVHSSANTSSTLTRRFSQQQQQQQASPIPTSNTIPRRFISHHRSSSHQTNYNNNNGTIQIDGYILSEFQQHLKAVTESKVANNQPIPSTSFVKRVFSEDIEPCLFFQQSHGWWKSSWFKKKLLDAISKNKCEIQYWNGTYHTSYMSTTTNSSSSIISATSSHLSTNSSNNTPSPPKTKCVCCNILRVCEFRMRLPPTTNPWLPLDRFCRDRIIAVCGYYSFMNNLKMLSTSTTLLNAFKQVMFHRRRMSLSRVGSISLFEDLDELMDERRHSSYRKSQHRSSNRESLVLDHSGSNSDSGSVVSVSDLQGLDGTAASQIVIVH
ncbi:hypothetical protein G6F43_001012 [Rhizopus delemar]|nr:hypothetical protein G6F43_001012 [Rhizopus delemar]